MNDEKLIERFINRIQKANEVFLRDIGKTIKKIKGLRPSEAHKLIQILRYGGDYNDIINQISKYTDLNIKDIDEVFSSYAKRDLDFNKRFYEYRNLPVIRYEDNEALRQQTEALARIVKNEMYDYTRNKVLGYTIRNNQGEIVFKGLKQVYNDILEEALINVGEGKETFDSSMRRILKSLGQSGLKTIDYESGRAVRLDSTVRMHLKARLTELHNENQLLFGQEFQSNGIEISVHENPAIDHEAVQGRQFSNEEWEKLQSGQNAKDYKGYTYNLDHDRKNGYRPIGELNCYHYIFTIILGVSEPEYSDDELVKIMNDNEKGFVLDGKHYTNYEGTQLQRQLERKIREQKDIQILARESGDDELVGKAQYNITQLTNKYNELNDVSGLPAKKKRLSVSGYRRIKRLDNNQVKPSLDLNLDRLEDVKVPEKDLDEEYFNLKGQLEDNKVKIIFDDIYNLKDKEIRNKNMEQLVNLSNKYPVGHIEGDNNKILRLNSYYSEKKFYAQADYRMNGIELNERYYNDVPMFREKQKKDIASGWHYKVPDDKIDIATITHEYGHIIEYDYIRKNKNMSWKVVDTDLRDLLMNNAMRKSGEKLTVTQFKDKYFSGYGKSKRNLEWFAELFQKYELGEQDPLTEALGEWLEGQYGNR